MKSFFFSRESAVDGGVGWEHPGQNPGYHKISVNTYKQLPLSLPPSPSSPIRTTRDFFLLREDGSRRKEKKRKEGKKRKGKEEKKKERKGKKKREKEREESPGGRVGNQFSGKNAPSHPIP